MFLQGHLEEASFFLQKKAITSHFLNNRLKLIQPTANITCDSTLEEKCER